MVDSFNNYTWFTNQLTTVIYLPFFGGIMLMERRRQQMTNETPGVLPSSKAFIMGKQAIV